jgi:hypothetical protein
MSSIPNPSAACNRSAIILKFPIRDPFVVRVEREQDGEGWFVIARSNGWAHGDFDSAIDDARFVVTTHGVTAWSSRGIIPQC